MILIVLMRLITAEVVELAIDWSFISFVRSVFILFVVLPFSLR